MIIADKKSGYGKGFLNIEYATIWHHDIFRQMGQMRFYNGNIQNVTDIYFSDKPNNLYVVVYPHCDTKELIPLATKNEEKLTQILKEINEKFPGLNYCTVDVEGGFLVDESHFTKFMPDVHEPKDELFFFDSSYRKDPFIRLYVYEAKHRKGTFGDVFPVFALCSDMLMPEYGLATDEGTQFTYNLMQAWLNRHFDGDCPPISTATFPTNEKVSLPEKFNTKELDKLIEKSGAQNLIMKGGQVVDEGDAVESVPEKSKEEDVYGKSAKTKLREEAVEQILMKGNINLSDAFQIGFGELASIVPYSDSPIDIFMDVAHVARKMCLYSGQFHVIPLQQTDESVYAFLEWIGEQDSLFHFVTEDSYPKKLLPAPKQDLP